MYTLFFDTDCDVTPKECAEVGAKLISMPYAIDGENIYPYVDFEEFKEKEFYDLLRTGVIPTTSAISEFKYAEYFEPELASGKDVLYVHFSRSMSGTFDSMDIAVEELRKKYPERKICTIDTKGITTLGCIVAKEVAEKYKAGEDLESIVSWAESEVMNYAMFFTCDDLRFFHRSGRVNGLSAMMGTLLGIRPLIQMDKNGQMTAIGKAKGRRNAIEYLANKVAENGIDVKNHPIMIGHSDAPELVKELKEAVVEKIGEVTFIEKIVNPTAGAHCGPNGVGIAFHGRKDD